MLATILLAFLATFAIVVGGVLVATVRIYDAGARLASRTVDRGLRRAQRLVRTQCRDHAGEAAGRDLRSGCRRAARSARSLSRSRSSSRAGRPNALLAGFAVGNCACFGIAGYWGRALRGTFSRERFRQFVHFGWPSSAAAISYFSNTFQRFALNGFGGTRRGRHLRGGQRLLAADGRPPDGDGDAGRTAARLSRARFRHARAVGAAVAQQRAARARRRSARCGRPDRVGRIRSRTSTWGRAFTSTPARSSRSRRPSCSSRAFVAAISSRRSRSRAGREPSPSTPACGSCSRSCSASGRSRATVPVGAASAGFLAETIGLGLSVIWARRVMHLPIPYRSWGKIVVATALMVGAVLLVPAARRSGALRSRSSSGRSSTARRSR